MLSSGVEFCRILPLTWSFWPGHCHRPLCFGSSGVFSFLAPSGVMRVSCFGSPWVFGLNSLLVPLGVATPALFAFLGTFGCHVTFLLFWAPLRGCHVTFCFSGHLLWGCHVTYVCAYVYVCAYFCFSGHLLRGCHVTFCFSGHLLWGCHGGILDFNVVLYHLWLE
jgi:hypothetical protein